MPSGIFSLFSKEALLIYVFKRTIMSKLVVLSGVPGSGKSYFSKALRNKKKGHVYIISSDALRDLVTGSQRNLTEEDLMWKMFYDLARVYSADKNGLVVLDATNTSTKYRIDSVKELKTHFSEADLIIFDIPKEVVLRQNLDREFPVPEAVIDEYFANFQLPQKEDYEFFKNVYIATGDNILEIIDLL